MGGHFRLSFRGRSSCPPLFPVDIAHAWSLLKYNERLGGYELNLTDAQLKGAPKFSRDAAWDWEDSRRAREINEYYKVPYGM